MDYLPAGEYNVTVSHEHAEHAQAKTCGFWHGKVATGVVEIEILDDARLAEIERGLAVKRRQAEADALAAAREYFKKDPARLAKLRISEPLRLVVQGTRRYWRVEYCGDNGLKARWVVITVDGTTGKVVIENSSKIGA
jgi:hypothetical protein